MVGQMLAVTCWPTPAGKVEGAEETIHPGEQGCVVFIDAAATTLYPQNTSESLRNSVARWAVLASIGFLLILPLQTWASWRLINEGFSSLEQGKPTVDEPLKAMEQAIREAPDAATLQSRLTILRGPAIAPADMQRPLPELKQILLTSLQQARANLLRRSKSEADPRSWVLIQDVIRFSIASVGFAAGFAAFAQRPGTKTSLLEEWTSALRRHRPFSPARSKKDWG